MNKAHKKLNAHGNYDMMDLIGGKNVYVYALFMMALIITKKRLRDV